MSVLLLDTNVVSFLMKAHPLAGPYRQAIAGHQLTMSFMTVAELLHGARRGGWGPRRVALLEELIAQYVVLPYTLDVCRWWADVRVARRNQPISSEDAWIAASALAFDLPLVTHNATDFANVPGLRLITRSGP